ncbi:MAG: ABC transporter permease [Suipraeoptans sp.]
MGNIMEYIKMALQNIKWNKGRSFLTMLGIIIGISSVITIVSIGDGRKNQMQDEVNSVGANQIYVYPNQESETGVASITSEDLEAVRTDVDGIEDATPSFYIQGDTNVSKGNFDVEMDGGNEAFHKRMNFDIKRGHYFTKSDVESGNKVCVITDIDAKRLFGSDDVLGMDVDVTSEGKTFTYSIIGVSKQRENGTFVSYSYEGAPVVLEVPYTSFTDYGQNIEVLDGFYAFTTKNADAQNTTNEVMHLLSSRHPSYGKDAYQVDSFKDQVKSINSMLSMVTMFIGFVAAISLLVGGIGVMNIMLVSVTERTREIGIRKSLGARTSYITAQFLFESAILTIIGGIIGIILGIIGAHGICAIISMAMGPEITPGISISTILTSTLFSTLVGIFFGIYPARKAAKLSPIEALRRN